MHRGINPHRDFQRVFRSNPLVHFEQVFVASDDGFFAVPRDRISEIEIDRLPGQTDAVPGIALLFRGTRRHIPRREIAV